MCGRITATFEFRDIRVRWDLDCDLPKYTTRFNVAPETSSNISVIVRQKGVNGCRLMHWGLIPSGAKDPTIGNRMINARAESLTEKPAQSASSLFQMTAYPPAVSCLCCNHLITLCARKRTTTRNAPSAERLIISSRLFQARTSRG
jgi:SOS response associated peptidase (SRAP)